MRPTALFNQPRAFTNILFAICLLTILQLTISEEYPTRFYLVCRDTTTIYCVTWVLKYAHALKLAKTLARENESTDVCGFSELRPMGENNSFVEVYPIDESKPPLLCPLKNLFVKYKKDLHNLRNIHEIHRVRARRQVPYALRGRYRGQTQSQYLAIDRGTGKDEGKAEAHSAADSSRASVSGTSGMGQAQSQSMYDPSCEECVGGSSDAIKQKTSGVGHGGMPSGLPSGAISTSGNNLPFDSTGGGQLTGNGPNESGQRYSPGNIGNTGVYRQPNGVYVPNQISNGGYNPAFNGGPGNDVVQRPNGGYGTGPGSGSGGSNQYLPPANPYYTKPNAVPGGGNAYGSNLPTIPGYEQNGNYGPGQNGNIPLGTNQGPSGGSNAGSPGSSWRATGPIQGNANEPNNLLAPNSGVGIDSNRPYQVGVPNGQGGYQNKPNIYGTGSTLPNYGTSTSGYGPNNGVGFQPQGNQGGSYPGSTSTQQRPDGQYIPGSQNGYITPTDQNGGQNGLQRPGGQYGLINSGGSLPGGQYNTGTTTGQNTLQNPSGSQYGPGVTGGQNIQPPGGPFNSNIGGASPGTAGNYLPGANGGQSTIGGPGGVYQPGGVGIQGPGSQYGPGNVGGTNTLQNPNQKYGPSGTNGVQEPGFLYDSRPNDQRPGNQYGTGVTNGQTFIPGTRSPGEQYGPISPSSQSGFQNPRTQYGQPGQGGIQSPGGQYGHGGSGGNQGPGSQYGSGGQGVPQGSGGQYIPGGQGGTLNSGSPYIPDRTQSPGSQYRPDGQGGMQIPGTQYGPGGQGGAQGPGIQYRPGQQGGVQGPGGQFIPGGTQGQGGQYLPGGQGGIQTPTGSYGQGGNQVPGSQYAPGGQIGTQGSGTQYDPNGQGGNQVPGNQYGPGGPSGTQGSGTRYGPNGQRGIQGSGIPYGPGVQGGTGIPGAQYTPGGQGGVQVPGTQYTPGQQGGVQGPGGQYIPGGQNGIQVPGNQYGNAQSGVQGPGGQFGTGTSPNIIPGVNGQYGTGTTGTGNAPNVIPGSNGQYGTGATGTGIAPNLIPGSNGQYGTGTPGGNNGLQSPGGFYGSGVNGVSTPGQTNVPGNYGIANGPYSPDGSGSPHGPYGNSLQGQGPGTPGAGITTNQNGAYSPGTGTYSNQYGNKQQDSTGSSGQYPGNVPFGYGNSQGVAPQNVIDPNSVGSIDGDDSEAQASVSQASNGTTAIASSKGGNDKGRAQTHVQGAYTGGGSFSAQAEISGENKAANSEVTGDKKGASSNAQGSGRNNKSQANVQLGSETGSVLTGSQSEGVMHSSNTQVQGSLKGGMADAQARGPGSTSSQAQIGFTPYTHGDKTHDVQKSPFIGGGTAAAQSSGRTGSSQSQLHGTFKYGITYNGGAQAGASLDKDTVFPNRLPFDKIDVYDEKNKNINVETSDKPSDLLPAESTDIPVTTEPNTYLIPSTTPLDTSINTEKIDPLNPVYSENDDEYGLHPHSDHHTTESPTWTPTRLPPVESRRSFQSSYGPNSGDYEYTTDKEDNQQEDYDMDDGFGSEGSDNVENGQGEFANYNEYSRDPETHQNLHSPKKKGLEVRQTTGGNTQHIVLGALTDHNAEITQRNSERPDESRIYQPGERVPGTGGYTIPIGFTGSVKSVASKDKTYVVGSKDSPSQAQTVSLTPGSGKVRYTYPTTHTRNVNPKNLRSLYNVKPDDNNRYMSVSKSVTRDLDSDNNIRKQYSHTYYTKSSSCGYFTFTCNMVSGADGKKKVCKPKIPTNPDGTPMRC